eukprot:gnl/TRDRNA2_/TRDRNA2_133624_c1_seq2.p1 gnl/TRDRNA2_/TRDRNA2_133624_c1~~gnl/TRDRNA2_/TRDRNA2_133624_c1_seq2.p1  ORF type:complete len:204 (-),score=30.35 gnl/TRDRNA2_/TRDRNA2_133624_c1_seq2:21-632(-)
MLDSLCVPIAAVVQNMAWMQNTRGKELLCGTRKAEVDTLEKILSFCDACSCDTDSIAAVARGRLAELQRLTCMDEADEAFRLYPFGRGDQQVTLALARTAGFKAKELQRTLACVSKLKPKSPSAIEEQDESGVPIFHIPVCEQLSSGAPRPFVLEHSKAEIATTYASLATMLVERMPEWQSGRHRRVFTTRATDWRQLLREVM